MRGLHVIGEALGPRFVCPSCTRQLEAGDTAGSALGRLVKGRQGARRQHGRGVATAAGVESRREYEGEIAHPQQQHQRQHQHQHQQETTYRERGLNGFRQWTPPQSTVRPALQSHYVQAETAPQDPSTGQWQWQGGGRSESRGGGGGWTVVDVPSRPRAGPLPLLEKRRLASLRRSDLVSMLSDFTSPRDESIIDLFCESSPDVLMHAFLGAEQYRRQVYSLPAPAFAEALRMLHPSVFVEPFKRIHRYFHPSVVAGKGFRSLAAVFGDFERMLAQVVQQREAGGHTIGLAECAHLLHCAQAMGNAAMADRVWVEMLARGLQPTTECYNAYMAAKIWDQAFLDKEKFNVRVTEWNLRKRAYTPANPNYRGYKTGGPHALHKQVKRLFNQMTADGLAPNEETIINVMTASARVGDMADVKRVLKAVWNIDVDALTTHGEGPRVPPVRPLSVSSPLHPTTALIYAIAHIFGSNNDFATALQLVDFLSRQYSIFIDPPAWQELLEWSFVLSLRRFHERAQANAVGLIPRATVKDIYGTMTMPPYNTKPNMVMVNIAVKQSVIRQMLGDTLKYMDDGYDLVLATLKKRNALQRTLVRHQLDVAPMPTSTQRKQWREQELQYLSLLQREWRRLQRKLGLTPAAAAALEAAAERGGHDTVDSATWQRHKADSVSLQSQQAASSQPTPAAHATATTAGVSGIDAGCGVANLQKAVLRNKAAAIGEADEAQAQAQAGDASTRLSGVVPAAEPAAPAPAPTAPGPAPAPARSTATGTAAEVGSAASSAPVSATAATSPSPIPALAAIDAAAAPATSASSRLPEQATARERIRRLLEAYRRACGLQHVVNPVRVKGFDGHLHL
ncbi:hypothetical protein KEM52_000836 [Ascosphaera acerosa]|nr:hypothetical protein KEM52_000836 [Ascosphaera acerosa]